MPLLGVLLKATEIDPNDMKWQILKDLGQEILNQYKSLKSNFATFRINLD